MKEFDDEWCQKFADESNIIGDAVQEAFGGNINDLHKLTSEDVGQILIDIRERDANDTTAI